MAGSGKVILKLSSIFDTPGVQQEPPLPATKHRTPQRSEDGPVSRAKAMLDKELAMKCSPQASFPTPKTPRNPTDSLDKAKRMLNDTLENIAAMERDNIYDKEAADRQRAEAHARFEMARAAFIQSEAEPSKSAEKPIVAGSTPGEDERSAPSKSIAKPNQSPVTAPIATPEAEKAVPLKANVITSAKKEDDVLSSLNGRSLVPMRIRRQMITHTLPDEPRIEHVQKDLFRDTTYEDAACDQVESLEITESSESEFYNDHHHLNSQHQEQFVFKDEGDLHRNRAPIVVKTSFPDEPAVFRDYKEESLPSVYSVSSREDPSYPSNLQRSQQIWVPESLEVTQGQGGNEHDKWCQLKTICEGTLLGLDGPSGIWKPRYFVLVDQSLYYYQDSRKLIAIERITLDHSTSVKVVDDAYGRQDED
ncbi:hypothetical protein GUITHDRAFT_147705 [Guillardia theta CCMP2712]|uniref:PH domain-containing protein n=1 Tax=Guillardia theta (strain CCMP2712) TaxID=905079 RepID=L1ID97_GUITC|nr:hypothetical protein GUITHDRAFT_147705 [Guillardia theta CCMP2712]EKX33780.1 hypothetical protein GUITHDRAFT_147705 [Guillardia theta CCMP2712]|eukprot:XP_005820760.1 hypothetical protein GUITHDRAFT_147705 [Guillardia theta CCMP2712]